MSPDLFSIQNFQNLFTDSFGQALSIEKFQKDRFIIFGVITNAKTQTYSKT